MNQFKYEKFNVCRLMADKAMHDLDYKAQLERSAYDHNKTIELAELNREVEKSMTAFRKRHRGYGSVAWNSFSGWTNYDDEGLERDSEHIERAEKDKRVYTVSLAGGTYAERVREAHVSTTRAPLPAVHAGLCQCWLQINVFSQTHAHSNS